MININKKWEGIHFDDICRFVSHIMCKYDKACSYSYCHILSTISINKSSNIPSKARLSGAAAESVFYSRIHEVVP